LGRIFALAGYDSDNINTLAEKMCQHHEPHSPDDHGLFVDSSVALGNVAVVKDSKAARQPLSSKSGRVVITFEGELYDTAKLKKQLDCDAHTAVSDAELVLQAYEMSGQDCLKQIDGVFAFCIWDSEKRQIMSARDRFGVKQLYYHRNGPRRIFASEIKTILMDPEVPRIPNHDLIRDYLLRGWGGTEMVTLFSLK
jgi:asparagine synthase (glutamine-hydrolysing)